MSSRLAEVAAEIRSATLLCCEVMSEHWVPSIKQLSLLTSSHSDINPTSCLLTLALEAPGQFYQRQFDMQAHKEIHAVPDGLRSPC